jgi:hypothetical protein
MAEGERLAATELAVASYRHLAASSDAAWRVAGVWGVLIVAAELLTGTVDPGMVDPETPPPATAVLVLALGLVANLVLLPTIMVGWYRYVLLGELPDGPAPPITARTCSWMACLVTQRSEISASNMASDRYRTLRKNGITQVPRPMITRNGAASLLLAPLTSIASSGSGT